MAKLTKYKTFNELKNSVEKSSISESRLADLVTDLDNFVEKVKKDKPSKKT